MFVLRRDDTVRFSRRAALAGGVLVLTGCASVLPDMPHDKLPLTSGALDHLAAIHSTPGSAMLIRLYKESSELELWKQTNDGTFALFRAYHVCKWSGKLGPKFSEGDYQAPEGFYTVTPGMMNPNSKLYLSFNTGFPNKYDRAYGRTGSNLMIHGDCRSVGCFAMTDDGIREIYAMARESFAGGNPSFQLQLFPYRMTSANIKSHADSPFTPFWENLKEGSDAFEASHVPPTWDVCGGRYVFNRVISADASLNPLAPCPDLGPGGNMPTNVPPQPAPRPAALA